MPETAGTSDEEWQFGRRDAWQERCVALEKKLDDVSQSLYEGAIDALVFTLELRDPYTASHQRRVAQLASVVAAEMDLPQDQINLIRLAAGVHDIGKISVPSEILSKRGVLSATEFVLLQDHPRVGHAILDRIPFHSPIADIVLQHHERMNGEGYPGGLKGEDIAVEARVLGLADVVEALISHRPYRAAHGVDAAVREISRNRGVLYDPLVVDALVSLISVKGFNLERDLKTAPQGSATHARDVESLLC